MKKYFIFAFLIFLMFPGFVYAEKITTKIVGNEKVQPTQTIKYTVIVDRPLTEYSAEISYDREVLNLVGVEEINISTATRDFNYDKVDPIKITFKSKEESLIIYSLTFSVKKFFKYDSTDITINTKLAKDSSDVFESVETIQKINVVEEDYVYQETEEEKPNELSKTLTSISNILKEYDNPIIIVSLSLNFVLIVLLIISIRRKKVDYDF